MRLHFHYVRQSEMNVLQIIIIIMYESSGAPPPLCTTIICANRERQFKFAYNSRCIHCAHNVHLQPRNWITTIFIDFDFQMSGAMCVAGSYRAPRNAIHCAHWIIASFISIYVLRCAVQSSASISSN